MIEQLLVPEDLMTAPVTATQELKVQYSHEDQATFTMQGALDRAFEGEQLTQTMYCMSTSTFSGTQTFDWRGNPNDSDSDSDSKGDC
jgi:hypothetical protein